MIAQTLCEQFTIPWWPLRPCWPTMAASHLLMVAGMVFSLLMLIDCLRRKPEKYPLTFTQQGRTERLIWAVGIVFTAVSFYFLGAILYYFIVKRERPEDSDKAQ